MSTEPDNSNYAKLLPQEEIKALLEVFPKGVIALDLETTGLSPLTDRIIEIAAVKVLPSENNFSIEVFDKLINPQTPIPELTTKIHGITDVMVVNSPPLAQTLPDFLKFQDSLPIIAHNALFDVGFVVFSIHHLGLEMPHSKVYCSCRLSRMTFKEFQGHGLAQVVEKLDIPLENHHRALDDSLASLRVFAKALIRDHLESSSQLQSSYLLNLKDFETSNDFEIPEHLEEIKEFIPEQKTLMIKYKGGSHGKNYRPIRPISLLPMPSGNILYAHCLLSDLYKSFALKKIKSYRECTTQEQEEYQQGIKK